MMILNLISAFIGPASNASMAANSVSSALSELKLPPAIGTAVEVAAGATAAFALPPGTAAAGAALGGLATSAIESLKMGDVKSMTGGALSLAFTSAAVHIANNRSASAERAEREAKESRDQTEQYQKQAERAAAEIRAQNYRTWLYDRKIG